MENFWLWKLLKLWYTTTLGISFTDIISGTLKSTKDVTQDFINVTHSSDVYISNNSITDSATVRESDTSTHNIVDSTISSKTHIITPTITGINSTNEISTQVKKAVDIPILLYYLVSGLLGLCFIICIVGLLLKCKSKSEKKVPIICPISKQAESSTLTSSCNGTLHDLDFFGVW